MALKGQEEKEVPSWGAALGGRACGQSSGRKQPGRPQHRPGKPPNQDKGLRLEFKSLVTTARKGAPSLCALPDCGVFQH